MSLFKRKKSINFTEASPSYKVKYLGNVATSLAQGDGYIEKPINILWSNYIKTNGSQSVPMRLTVDNAGLKVTTSSQGLTQYWCHRISRFAVPEGNPKLFVWIYRHVGKKMKAELRCHAVCFPHEKKAAEVSRLLQEKKEASLHEYLRDKSRRHKKKLVLERAQALADALKEPARKTLLNPGRNYKPPLEYSLKPPPLDSITEDGEEMDTDGGLSDLGEEDEDEGEALEPVEMFSPDVLGSAADFLEYRCNGTHSDSDDSLDRLQMGDAEGPRPCVSVYDKLALIERPGVALNGVENDAATLHGRADINSNEEKVHVANGGGGIMANGHLPHALHTQNLALKNTLDCLGLEGDLHTGTTNGHHLHSTSNGHNGHHHSPKSLFFGGAKMSAVPNVYATLPSVLSKTTRAKQGHVGNGMANGTANGMVGNNGNGDMVHLKSEEMVAGDNSSVKHSNSLLSKKGLYSLWPGSRKKANPVEATKVVTSPR